MQELWAQVDDYFSDLLAPADEALSSALQTNRQASLPAIDVPPTMGKLLEILIRITGTHRVLEVGTLGAYSTIWLARAIPEGGQVVTLEISEEHAQVARANLARADVLDRVDLRVGPAQEALSAMIQSRQPAFDFIFLDADKKSLPVYLELALELSRPGTLIVADNVVRDGKVIDAHSSDPHIQGVRRFMELVAAHPRLSATALQTVCGKGYDGFALALVTA